MQGDQVPRAQLMSIPSRMVEYETDDDGKVVLLVPQKVGGPLGRLLQHFVPQKEGRLKLDEVGSSVWLLVNGIRTVEQISDELAKEMGQRVEPRYERVLAFLASLKSGAAVDFDLPASERKNHGTS